MRHWQTGFLQFWRQDNHLGLDHENTAAVTLSEGYNIVLLKRVIRIIRNTYMIHEAIYVNYNIYVLVHKSTGTLRIGETDKILYLRLW